MNRILPILALAMVLTPGCASAFLHGARMVGRGAAPPAALGTWRIERCVDTNQSPVMGPDATYVLTQGASGLELFERSADGSGAMIENQWSEADGTHFYTWVMSNGWEFIIPGPGQPGVRRVYAGTGTTDARPNGTWTAICDLTPM